MRVIPAVVIALVLSGCIGVPVPHNMWISPELSGTIRDAETIQPIEGATVKLTGYVPGRQAELVLSTGPDGKYSGVVLSRERYYYLFFAPADSVCRAQIAVSHPGFEPKQVTRSRAGGGSGSGPCAGWRESVDFALERVASNKALERGRD